MAEGIQYKRVLLKVSGEALAGDAHRGLDFAVIGEVCEAVRQAYPDYTLQVAMDTDFSEE